MHIAKDNFEAKTEGGELNSPLQLFLRQLEACITDSSALNNFLDNEEAIVDTLKDNPYEILALVVSILYSNNNVDDKITSRCHGVLQSLARHCEPSELLLYILEQMEIAKLDHCFYSLLGPLKATLIKCKNYKQVIDYCIDILKKFISNLPVIEKSDKSSDKSVERIITSYNHIISFVDGLFNHHQTLSWNDSQDVLKYLLLDFLFSMFGEPVCLAEIDYKQNLPTFREIIKNILNINCDIVNFFRILNNEEFFKHVPYSKNIMTQSYYLKSSDMPLVNVPRVAFCNLYWFIFVEMEDINICQVYNPYYISYNLLNMANFLLSYKRKNVLIEKGLDLMQFAINYISNKLYFIPYKSLELFLQGDIINNLSNLILYGETMNTSRRAHTVFTMYVNSFDTKAKYLIIQKILNLNYPPTITNIAIGMIKTCASESLKNDESKDASLFLGKSLQFLISRICLLKDGDKTDLFDISDQLITTLNLVLFLIIRDRKRSGILEYLEETKYEFLNTLKDITPTQRTQWMAEVEHLKRVKEDKATIDSVPEVMFSKYSYISLEEKIKMGDRAVNILTIVQVNLDQIYEYLAAIPPD